MDTGCRSPLRHRRFSRRPVLFRQLETPVSQKEFCGLRLVLRYCCFPHDEFGGCAPVGCSLEERTVLAPRISSRPAGPHVSHRASYVNEYVAILRRQLIRRFPAVAVPPRVVNRPGIHTTPTMSFNGPDSLVATSPSTCRTSSSNARIVL